jgi:hypothetical protein
LIAFLNTGKNLMISSQDYYYDRGLTTLMVDYLGVATVTNDVAQTVVTGAGSALTGLGPYVLSYPFSNFSDAVYPNNSAATAFMGDKGSAAVSVDSPIFRTVYLGFPFEALPGAAEREAVLAAMLAWFRPFIDCNDNGIPDHADIALGPSLAEDGDGIPDECQVPLLGDMNCDGTVDSSTSSPRAGAREPAALPEPVSGLRHQQRGRERRRIAERVRHRPVHTASGRELSSRGAGRRRVSQLPGILCLAILSRSVVRGMPRRCAART